MSLQSSSKTVSCFHGWVVGWFVFPCMVVQHVGKLEKAFPNGWFICFDPNHVELDHHPQEAAKLLGWDSSNGDHQNHHEVRFFGAITRFYDLCWWDSSSKVIEKIGITSFFTNLWCENGCGVLGFCMYMFSHIRRNQGSQWNMSLHKLKGHDPSWWESSMCYIRILKSLRSLTKIIDVRMIVVLQGSFTFYFLTFRKESRYSK